jgi:predicted amidophosphoribosyltransferase
MGELLYQLKYKQQPDEVAKIVALLDQIQGIETFDALVPIPPTNKNRAYQPVPLIAEALGVRRNVPVLADLLQNSGTEELKSITDPVARLELLKAAITISGPNRVAGKKVLLIDDLYRSGSTLNVATDIIMSQGKAERVCVLTMTKTRSSR